MSIETNPKPPPRKYGDLAFAGLVLSIVALLIIPLPTFMLDILLTTNIAIAVVLLLTSLYVKHPLRISTFPSILLFATLFRLALNVSSTRLILSDGFAGDVIESFGEFVVQGNFVVGAVIFLILTVIQFLVIAKGSERVAEVAARFTLDAMPGKQMAIDADLRAGAFSLDEARRRRADVQKESRLFGAMDGAMKFVKGDAIAGIIITVINVVGGLIIGITQQGMAAGEAATTYTLLTVGDGLVSQIPALLVSVCAGVIVTRVAGDDEDAPDLGSEIIGQLTETPRVFAIASVMLMVFAIVPGLPIIPFALLGLLSAGVAFILSRKVAEQERADAERDALDAAPSSGGRVLISAVTPIVIELGTSLTAAVRAAPKGEDQLRDEVQRAREALFSRLGVRLPSVRIRFDRPGLKPNQVCVQIYEVPELAASIDVEKRLAMIPARLLEAQQGINANEAIHPVSGVACSMIPIDQVDAVQQSGIGVLDLPQHIMAFMVAAARRCAGSFVGLSEVQIALDQLQAANGPLIDAVTPRPVSLAKLTGVFKRLVEEDVSIRDVRAVLEALAESAREDHDVIALTEIARQGLGRAIVSQHTRGSNVVRGFLVDGAIERMVRDAIRVEDGRPRLALSPAITEDILSAFRKELSKRGQRHIVVCDQDVRRYLRQLIRLEFTHCVVLGHSEIAQTARVESVGIIRVGS